jgi:hypothetical protein
VVQFGKKTSWNLPGGTEENYKKNLCHDRVMSRPRLEPGISRMQGSNVTTSATLLVTCMLQRQFNGYSNSGQQTNLAESTRHLYARSLFIHKKLTLKSQI